jgi:hypothetical protein
VDTTVLAQDGETVAIGGMITKHDAKEETKIPWFGDLPYVGALFRYRTETKDKTELIVILTPHIIRSRADADMVLAQESKRIDWIISEVMNYHGTTGLEPIFPRPAATLGDVVPEDLPEAPLLLPPPGTEEVTPPPRPVPSAPAKDQKPADSVQAPAEEPPPATEEEVPPLVLPAKGEAPADSVQAPAVPPPPIPMPPAPDWPADHVKTR